MGNLATGLVTGTVIASLSFVPLTTFAGKDSLGNEIVVKEMRSSVGLGYESINEADKNLDKIGIDAIFLTPFGGFKIIGDQYSGEQTIFPEWSNIVTNGGQDIGTYDFEKGSIGIFGGGYGIDNVWNDNRIIAKLGGFLVDGETDIASNVVGHMSRKGSGLHAQLSYLDVVSDLGVKAYFCDRNIVEISRFYEGRSSEELDLKRVILGARIPVVLSKVSAEVEFERLDDSSDLSYKDGSPGALLIPRDVFGSGDTVSLGGIAYNNFLVKDYWKIMFSVLRGNTRHEFSSAELSGYGLRLERGFGNNGQGNFLEPASTLFLEGNYRDSSSAVRYPGRDPMTGIPIGLNFSENREEWSVAAGYDSTNWAIDVGYTHFEKNGSTVIDVPVMGGVRIPFVEGDLALKTFSLGTKYALTDNLQGKIGVSRELNYGKISAGLVLIYNL